jgi:hypothetical protein
MAHGREAAAGAAEWYSLSCHPLDSMLRKRNNACGLAIDTNIAIHGVQPRNFRSRPV